MSLEINKILIKIEKILIQKQNKQNIQFCSDLKHDLNQKICIKQPWNKLTTPAGRIYLYRTEQDQLLIAIYMYIAI